MHCFLFKRFLYSFIKENNRPDFFLPDELYYLMKNLKTHELRETIFKLILTHYLMMFMDSI